MGKPTGLIVVDYRKYTWKDDNRFQLNKYWRFKNVIRITKNENENDVSYWIIAWIFSLDAFKCYYFSDHFGNETITALHRKNTILNSKYSMRCDWCDGYVRHRKCENAHSIRIGDHIVHSSRSDLLPHIGRGWSFHSIRSIQFVWLMDILILLQFCMFQFYTIEFSIFHFFMFPFQIK